MSSHLTDSLIAGAISGGVTRLVAAPLDVLKIRFQLQLEPIKVIQSDPPPPCSIMNHDHTGWVQVFWCVECS